MELRWRDIWRIKPAVWLGGFAFWMALAANRMGLLLPS